MVMEVECDLESVPRTGSPSEVYQVFQVSMKSAEMKAPLSFSMTPRALNWKVF